MTLRLHPHGVAFLLLATGLAIGLLDPLGAAGQSRALGLCTAAIGLWATRALPDHLTALGFLGLALLGGLAPPGVVLAGLGSGAFWLVLAGMVLGVAIRRTGLGDSVAARLAGLLQGGYTRVIFGVTGMGLALAFLMPSALGRIALLAPLAVALAERLGYAEGRPGRTGIVLAACFGTFIPAFAILPANVPNLVLAGAAESLHGVVPGYADYLLLHFPVLGALKALVIAGLVRLLHRDGPPAGRHETAPPPLTLRERRLAWILAAALGLWMSDALHHLPPAWIGAAAAAACLLPGLDLVPARSLKDKLSLPPLVFLLGVFGLGGVVAASGLGSGLADLMARGLPFGLGPAADFMVLGLTATGLSLVTTLPGLPAVLTPLAPDMAAQTGLALETVLMAQVLGFSNVLLPYQAPPVIVAMQMSGQPMRHAIRLGLVLTAVTVLLLWPLDFVWWTLLDRI